MIPEQIDKEEDCQGMICPLPVLRTKKALADMPTGHILKVITTDPSSEQDIPMFAKHTGNLLVGQEKLAGKWVFYLRRR